MHVNDVRRMQAEKDLLMRNEGTHPANRTEAHRFKHDMMKEQNGTDENAHGVDLV